MKKSKLYEIQDVAIQIANTLATMLQVDVEIIDCAHMRVAATGHFACRVNQSNVGEGHAYRDTLETGKKMFIDNPGQNPYCGDCKEKDTCDALLEVSAPIIVDDRIEGAIGLTCYKEDREQFMVEHLQESMFFLEQMCMLVAGKIKERTNLQKHLSASRMLHAMMGMVDKGVLILDQEGKLLEYNGIAAKELKLDPGVVGQPVNIILTGDVMMEKREYKVVIGSTVTPVVGWEEHFEDSDDAYGLVLVFDSIRYYRDQVYNMAYHVVPHDIHYIIGHSEYTVRIKKEINQAAAHTGPVLIEGEEGTGKKTIGTAIWKASQRAEKPFVYFNCASVEEDLLEERLFGATGQDKTGMGTDYQGTMGVMEMANEGILYLDEIDEMPMFYQAKLEQFLDEKYIQRKGSFQKIPVNVRLICATKKNLLRLTEKNKFRKPLYYSICINRITAYPLRKRKEDIPELVNFYIDQFTQKYRIYYRQMDEETLKFLCSCNWKGNITELEKTIEHMVNALPEDGVMDMKTVPQELFETADEESQIMTLEQLEQREIRRAIRKFGDSKKGKEQAAEALGIGIATLYRKLDKMT